MSFETKKKPKIQGKFNQNTLAAQVVVLENEEQSSQPTQNYFFPTIAIFPPGADGIGNLHPLQTVLQMLSS